MDVTQIYISEFIGTAVLIAFGNTTNVLPISSILTI